MESPYTRFFITSKITELAGSSKSVAARNSRPRWIIYRVLDGPSLRFISRGRCARASAAFPDDISSSRGPSCRAGIFSGVRCGGCFGMLAEMVCI